MNQVDEVIGNIEFDIKKQLECIEQANKKIKFNKDMIKNIKKFVNTFDIITDEDIGKKFITNKNNVFVITSKISGVMYRGCFLNDKQTRPFDILRDTGIIVQTDTLEDNLQCIVTRSE